MTSLSRNLVVGLLLSLCSIAAAPAAASITRISGPAGIFGESRLFVKFDVAFDSVNNVYLVVWGTQQHGPVNGMFLDRNGTPISAVFPVSEGPQQSGWARVVYSPEQGRFLVAYTKIVTSTVHQRTARFVQWARRAEPAMARDSGRCMGWRRRQRRRRRVLAGRRQVLHDVVVTRPRVSCLLVRGRRSGQQHRLAAGADLRPG